MNSMDTLAKLGSNQYASRVLLALMMIGLLALASDAATAATCSSFEPPVCYEQPS